MVGAEVGTHRCEVPGGGVCHKGASRPPSVLQAPPGLGRGSTRRRREDRVWRRTRRHRRRAEAKLWKNVCKEAVNSRSQFAHILANPLSAAAPQAGPGPALPLSTPTVQRVPGVVDRQSSQGGVPAQGLSHEGNPHLPWTIAERASRPPQNELASSSQPVWIWRVRLCAHA